MPNSRPSAVTIGAYDGVHLGHRRVIDTVRSIAFEEGLRSVVVTFDRHPATVVRPESAPNLLTDLDQKLELLVKTGVDEVVVINFDEERASETAEAFVEDVLVGRLDVKVVVVGSDFHFGKGRGGNVALLEAMGEERGFRVVGFGLVEDPVHGQTVSSTRIRSLISEGELGAANLLLGRAYEVRGELCGLEVRVPAEILLPAAGDYGAQVAPISLSSKAEPVEVSVPLLPGSLRLSRELSGPLQGERVIVTFPGPQGSSG
ncbi:MAG: adenylyltransferase/cytidyltransferase family protein [Acidimicrobiales bacterium]